MRSQGIADSHIHLQDYDPETDVRAIVSEAREAGVSLLVCNGTEESDWRRVLDYARELPGVIACLGLHPWFVGERSESWLADLEELIRQTGCGVGETGLDRLHKPVDREAQEEVFLAQLDLGRRYQRPVTVHCVRAWGWIMDVLRAEDELPPMLMHAYGGSVDLVAELAEMGAYFSFSGTALDPRHKHAREALAAVPRDRLLIETDAPNMLPPEEFAPHKVMERGREYNHPANLPAVLAGIAGLLGEPSDALRETLWENSMRFFGPILQEG